ncbi:haloacid dehalogenase-like hydrolase [Brevibacillus laterosporus]|uniref:haloacid dehalogenase-like hydrolase n=1 Tax=Brevibacillus laterosporus TaxID=1465 RepID=UPI001EF222F7|nr:haloacid dehalogenase-like hydrolase [Brevibacillus laterosporus]MCG7315851.1 haloacid dehalogenase-like hydrolase [Brevibacillus laterosporus]
MKKTKVLLSVGLSLSLMLGAAPAFAAPLSTASATQIAQQQLQMLDKGKWAEKTHAAVQKMIDQYGVKSPNYKADKKPYAVFDWDNTSIMHDTQEALLIYQINHLNFKLTPEEFAKVLVMNVPKGPFADKYKTVDGKTITMENVSADIISDYKFLYENYKGFKGKKSLEEVTKSDQFIDFRTKMYFLYEAINGSHGSDVGYPWVLYFLTNMSVDEVHELAELSNDYGLGDSIRKINYTSPKTLSGKAGVISVTYTSGLRLSPEVANMMNTFRSNGIDVYVVSASMKEVVEVFASNPKYGYNIPKENVIGMELEKDAKGVMQPVYKKDWFKTVYGGKTEVIKAEIAKKHGGNGPLFIGGDSNGDYEMMTQFPDTKLALILNLLKDGNIGKLSKQAVDEMKKQDPKFVLQGRDENTGMWIPTESSIKVGSTKAELLPSK